MNLCMNLYMRIGNGLFDRISNKISPYQTYFIMGQVPVVIGSEGINIPGSHDSNSAGI